MALSVFSSFVHQSTSIDRLDTRLLRRAYQKCHTYATVALMAGANPAYIARQLGHKNSKMVHETYSRWIDGADKHAERNRINAARAQCPQRNLWHRNGPARGVCC